LERVPVGGEIIVARLENGEDLLECFRISAKKTGSKRGDPFGYGTLVMPPFSVSVDGVSPSDFTMEKKEEG